MKRLIIVGAGGFGRTLLDWVKRVPNFQYKWPFIGFIDDNPKALEAYNYPHSVVGSPTTYHVTSEDEFLLAIAEPKAKLNVVEALVGKGAKFISFCHPQQQNLSGNIKLGYGTCFGFAVSIGCDTEVADWVHVDSYAHIGHDVTIGSGTTVSAHCNVLGRVKIGKGVFLGAGAIVLPSVSIGDFARVGAGSVVVRPVLANQTVFSPPAKLLC
ncbi:acetyltransferase [Pajaroellobacter abortibovis]|uniref:PglD N-terminal domain-containing protein n=1 Tax=Pajaroellobacter abortibovis TaxID=1882918 RepID=A0A1L6MYS5_9BACT|nr:acetyltransferase [Pajaroellobacter abortibovis]APS00607.1 hypothetical protein BCY86_07925 [Pajaroellobacter abortibovis]